MLRRKTYSHDVRTRTTSVVKVPRISDLRMSTTEVEVFGRRIRGRLVLRVPGRAEERYPDLEGPRRLSPSGNYVLAVENTRPPWRGDPRHQDR